MAASPVPDILAAVDLGSNSFHMVVARYTHGQIVIMDRLREMVRLGAGVEENGRIDKDVAARALACLERFGQRLRDMHADSVRVVGTNTLTYLGTDASGNTNSAVRTVIVRDTTPPAITWSFTNLNVSLDGISAKRATLRKLAFLFRSRGHAKNKREGIGRSGFQRCVSR